MNDLVSSQRLKRLALALLAVLTLGSASCETPPDEAPPPPDCTQNLEVDTTSARTLLGSLACTWPFIVEDRSSPSSNDLSLTHGVVYGVVISADGVTIPADTGDLVFGIDAATFEENDTDVDVTIIDGDDQMLLTWKKAEETVVVVYANGVTRANYRLSFEEPPSPLFATGAYSDLTPLASTFRGSIDFASAFETNADGELIEATPAQTLCEDFVMTMKTSGVVDIEVGDADVNYPYRPRQTSITQFSSNGTERTQMTWFEPDGRRLTLEATRAEGSDDDFDLERVSVQVAEGANVIAEYTSSPATSSCD
jgi:hypothetical protein